ncbi:unnamed protein product [Anisakis simplex]|uniref:Ion_trans_2 domain-containing protein n=1 Tax=Anisakis simplex TaxID=6269 RepID=A0A0M3K731_ANISI|nr:unnamed protein product [Anisakis simplex]
MHKDELRCASKEHRSHRTSCTIPPPEQPLNAASTSHHPSRFHVQKSKVDFGTIDDSIDREFECNHFLFNDYFKNDNSIDNLNDQQALFSPYDVLMRLQFPFKKNRRTHSHFLKFKNYWENYSFYAIWRKKFIEDHCCDEQDIWKEFFIASVPHLIINLFLVLYVIGGAVIFQIVDESIRQNPFHMNVVAADERRLPVGVVVGLLLTHSMIGGVLFHLWIDHMPIIPAIYFSFVSITTIGYGDITPTPSSAFQTFIIICYLSIGMVIMSTFVAALYNYLRRLHYLGRNFSGAANVEVWFGGTRMSITELLHIVADQFDVSIHYCST